MECNVKEVMNKKSSLPAAGSVQLRQRTMYTEPVWFLLVCLFPDRLLVYRWSEGKMSQDTDSEPEPWLRNITKIIIGVIEQVIGFCE